MIFFLSLNIFLMQFYDELLVGQYLGMGYGGANALATGTSWTSTSCYGDSFTLALCSRKEIT
jgi:hypothetical protein